VGLTVWSRRRIAEKNRGLYLQIKVQERLAEELEAMKKQYGRDAMHCATTGNQQQQLVSRLRDYLLCDKNFTQTDIDSDALASTLATNRTTLYRALKAVTGKTLQDYIQFMRIEEAKRMLKSSPELTITAIVELCGFNSRSSFYRQFNEQYHISPAEFRKLAVGGRVET